MSSLEEINNTIYNKGKNKCRDEIETEYIDAIGSYIKVVSLFSNNEMNLNTFDTGFQMELWRYILMDTVIHPIQHIIYQYLKNDNYRKIVDVIMTSEVIFEKYSEGKKAYKLSEFEIDRIDYQNKLEKMAIKFHSNKAVKEFIQINRAGNA